MLPLFQCCTVSGLFVFRDVCLLSSCFNKSPEILSTSGAADAVTACQDGVVRDTVRLECRVKGKQGGQETSRGRSGAESPPMLTSSYLTVSRKFLYVVVTVIHSFWLVKAQGPIEI